MQALNSPINGGKTLIAVSYRDKKRALDDPVLFRFRSCQLDSAGDFARTEAMSAHIDVLGGAVDNCLHTLDIGLPGTVGAAVRVGNLNAEHNALVTKITFSHSLLPPRWFMITPKNRCVDI